MLTIESLECFAPGNPKSKLKKRILDVDKLELPRGEFVAVVGPNGAGKSTFIKALAGDMPISGNIRLNEKNLSSWSTIEKARHIGVLPQSSQLSFSFSAAEVVALGLTPLSLPYQQAQAEIERHMKLTDCAHLANQTYPMLSGGEKQRVQLARVLLQLSQASQPPLLLLDEPTSAQDLAQQHGLLKLVRELAQKQHYAVIAILHDLNQVFAYCDRCLIIQDGQIRAKGSPDECLSTDQIEQYWGYRPEILQAASHKVVI